MLCRCSKICVILSSVAPILSRVTILQIASSDLSSDLVSITKRFGPEATDAAVQALSFLSASKHLSQPKNRLKMPLFGVSKMFYSFLYTLYTKATSDDYSKLQGAHRANMYRALSILGSVCAYNADIFEEGDEKLAMSSPPAVVRPDQLMYSNLSVNIFNMLRVFLAKLDAPTKCAALAALAGCFSGRPKLMLKAQVSRRRCRRRCRCPLIFAPPPPHPPPTPPPLSFSASSRRSCAMSPTRP